MIIPDAPWLFSGYDCVGLLLLMNVYFDNLMVSYEGGQYVYLFARFVAVRRFDYDRVWRFSVHSAILVPIVTLADS